MRDCDAAGGGGGVVEMDDGASAGGSGGVVVGAGGVIGGGGGAAAVRKLTLSQIYAWIRDNFAYYRGEDISWQVLLQCTRT